MYSISNDDNDYYAGYCYDSGFTGAENVPFYPYVGQPVVYYSHIAAEHLPQRHKVTKKNNPNCFVKAFRWYTQELPSPQLVAPCNNTNIGGFATWLDKKYEKYLQDGQCENNCEQYRSKQCSFTKSDKTISRVEYPSRKTRKFPRLKSPWKKKRRYIHETERDTACKKQSFEFILRPQDMSRPASECCQKTSYCIRSDTTFITSKCAMPSNFKNQSKSLMCISKTKDEFEKDIMITNYDVSQCYEIQKSEERSRIVPNQTIMKANTENIISDCYNTDLRIGMNYDNIATTRKQSKSVNCQCATDNIPYKTKNHNVFKKVSYSKLPGNAHDVNKCNNKTQRSREETRIVTECSGITNQKLSSTTSNKSNTKDVICACDQSDLKYLRSSDKETFRRNRYKTVICECSMSNFLNDDTRYQNHSKASEVFKKISRHDLNRNEYDDNKCVIQRQTSREITRVVTKCSEQSNKMEDCKSRLHRKNRDVICECYLDSSDLNNALNHCKVATKAKNKTIICQCPKNYIQRNNYRQQFECKEQQICQKNTQENFHQTCCPCPKPLEPKLQQAQIGRSSINCNSMKTSEYKKPFNSKELPVHGVQTSDHSIRFQEDSFLVKTV